MISRSTAKSTNSNPAKSTLFRHQFRLPDSQTPLQEITAELTISPPINYAPNATQGEKDRDRDRGYHYAGKLHLSESYLCFSTQPTSFLQTASTSTSSGFTGQTHGAGPGGNGFTLPLCAIRRVERLHSQSYQVCSPGPHILELEVGWKIVLHNYGNSLLKRKPSKASKFILLI